jgi:hypothetical protein
MKRCTSIRLITALVLSLIPGASTSSASAQSPPDWTGFYALARGKDLGSFKPLNPNLHEVIVAHLQPWARAKMEATDGVADDPGGTCQPDGIFRYPTFAGSFLWLPSADKILIVYNEINTAGVERVYLNRQHPKNLLPTWNGDSIGHWEGDTLVVDTIGFNDKSWLQPGMEPHSEETHLIQRIRQVGNGGYIEITTKVEDYQALTSAYTYSRYYKRTGESMSENVCAEDPQIWKDFRNKALKPHLARSREVK